MMLNYCTKCKRVICGADKCNFCGCESLKELKEKAPVNIIGTKLKGRVLKIKEDKISILINTENSETILKEYTFDKIKKIV